MFKTFFKAAVAALAGVAELFATVMVALCLITTGAVEERINSAISTILQGLRGLELPAVLAPAAHEVADFMGRMPQWALVCFALWGIFRALMAIHGHGAWTACKEAFREWRAAISVTKVTKKATTATEGVHSTASAMPGSGTVVTS